MSYEAYGITAIDSEPFACLSERINKNGTHVLDRKTVLKMPHTSIPSMLSYGLHAIRKRGIGFLVVYFRESIWFDLRRGTRTSSRVPKSDQTFADGAEKDDGLLYVASFTSVTMRSVAVARQLLGNDRYRVSQFCDLGCGKGKALLVHALHNRPLQQRPAIGIEYDPELAQLARENLARCSIPEHVVSVITDSATNLRHHVTAETLIVYIYNSFQGETLRAVLSELGHFPHVLIYVDPSERAMLSEFDYVIHEDIAGKYNADTWLVAAKGIPPGA
jgi:hypothetical protein